MRIPKKKVKIAIFGRSGTGKSVVAEQLRIVLERKMKEQIKVRYCGEVIKSKAKELGGKSISELPITEHMEIDSETRFIANDLQENDIIEGRYLNYVLRNCTNIIIFELICNDVVRCDRLKKRLAGKTASPEYFDVSAIDRDDDWFVNVLFTDIAPLSERIRTIDTTNMSIHEIVSEIVASIKT